MSAWPAAILFDFDGVIVNSEPIHLRAFQLAAATEGINLTSEEYFGELIGYDDAGAWRRIFELHHRPLNDQAIARVMKTKFARMRELMARSEIPPLPGAAEFVRTFAARGTPLAICSAAVRDEVMTILGGSGLVGHFCHITCAEDVTVGKPDPSGYVLTLRCVSEKIGRALAARDCLVIEDAPAVLQSVKPVGFKTLGVATSHPLPALSHADWTTTTLRRMDLSQYAPELVSTLNYGSQS